MKDLATIEREIREAQERVARLSEEREALRAMAPENRLADAIHGKMCRWNHTDQCGYEYESWRNPGRTREEYAEKARRMLALVDEDTAVKVISAL